MLIAHLTVHRRRTLAVAVIGLVAVLLLVRQHAGAGAAPAPLRVSPLRVSPVSARRPAVSLPVVVDVAGPVRRPGLYRLAQGARVADAVARAGGLTRSAERSAVNLAARVADGQQVLVATRGSPAAVAGAAVTGVAGAAAPAAPVSLSSGSAEQLDTLPGVGPVTAQKIIAFREAHGPFTSVEGLDAIPGIGPARIADLQGLVVP